MKVKLNHWIALSIVTLLSACDSAKNVQSFNIYIVGDYSLEEGCESSVRVNITRTKISSGESQCDISNISLIETEPGWQFRAKNCTSDLNPVADDTEKVIKILVPENNNMKIDNWFKGKPASIFKCE